MPTKRKRASRAMRTRITPDAIAAFKAGDHMRLHSILRLKPWEISPLDAEGESPWPETSAGGKSWGQAVELREEITNADQ